VRQRPGRTDVHMPARGMSATHTDMLRGRDSADAQLPRRLPQFVGERGPGHAACGAESLQGLRSSVPSGSHARSTPPNTQMGSTIRGLSSFAA
jgi:hypothetical protein